MKKVVEVNQDSEKELVARAVVNREAFGILYEYYYPRLYNYVLVRVGDYSLADDLVSIIFEKVVRKLSYYDANKGRFSTWLFTVANHTVVDYFRRVSQNYELAIEMPEVISTAEKEEDPLEKVLRNDTKLRLLEAVGLLDERTQNIVAMKFWGGLTNRRIAQLLEMNERTVGVVLFRAMKRLKQILMGNNAFEIIVPPYCQEERNEVMAGV